MTSFSSLTGFRSGCANDSHIDLDKTVDSLTIFYVHRGFSFVSYLEFARRSVFCEKDGPPGSQKCPALCLFDGDYDRLCV